MGKEYPFMGNQIPLRRAAGAFEHRPLRWPLFFLCSSWDDIDKVSTGTFVGHLQTVRAEIYNGRLQEKYPEIT
jgi:hypothetical protein